MDLSELVSVLLVVGISSNGIKYTVDALLLTRVVQLSLVIQNMIDGHLVLFVVDLYAPILFRLVPMIP